LLDLILLIVSGLAILIAVSWYSGRRPYDDPSKSRHTMLYSHDSRDIASEVYYPTYRDTTMVFPRSKREERKKTKTHDQQKRDL